MKNIMKLITAFVLVVTLFVVADQTKAEASEKIYREYDFNKELSKFPMKLSSGLTVNKKKVDGKYVPTIQQGNTVIWEGYSIDSDASTLIGFTVSKNNDTFLYMNHGYRGSDIIEVIGVSGKGKKFLEKTFKGDGVGMRATFLNANTIDIAVERYNEDYVSMAEIYTGDYTSTIYKLYAKGTVEQVPYIDKEFVNLAKQGKLKGAPGQVKGTFQSLKTHADFNKGSVDYSEAWRWYSMPYAQYAFQHSSNTDSILNKQTIHSIYKGSNIKGTRKQLGPELKKLFGAPIYNSQNEVLVYRAGKNYVGIRYENYNGIQTVTLAVMDAEYYKLVKVFGL